MSKRSVCLAFPPSLLLQMGSHKPALSVAHGVDFSPHVGSSLQRIALLFRLIMYPLTATRPAQTAALMSDENAPVREYRSAASLTNWTFAIKSHFSTLHMFKVSVQHS